MKKFLVVILAILIHSNTVIKSQDNEDDSSFIKSIQGTWAYCENGAELWLKVVIKGHNLKGYAAYPNSGKFTAESKHKIRVVKLIYRSNTNRNLKSEYFAQIRNSTLADDRIYLGTKDGKNYIVFGNKDSQKLMKVQTDFNPWK